MPNVGVLDLGPKPFSEAGSNFGRGFAEQLARNQEARRMQDILSQYEPEEAQRQILGSGMSQEMQKTSLGTLNDIMRNRKDLKTQSFEEQKFNKSLALDSEKLAQQSKEVDSTIAYRKAQVQQLEAQMKNEDIYNRYGKPAELSLKAAKEFRESPAGMLDPEGSKALDDKAGRLIDEYINQMQGALKASQPIQSEVTPTQPQAQPPKKTPGLRTAVGRKALKEADKVEKKVDKAVLDVIKDNPELGQSFGDQVKDFFSSMFKVVGESNFNRMKKAGEQYKEGKITAKDFVNRARQLDKQTIAGVVPYMSDKEIMDYLDIYSPPRPDIPEEVLREIYDLAKIGAKGDLLKTRLIYEELLNKRK